MTILKSGTKYKIKSVEQLLEIKEQCEKQRIKFNVHESWYSEVKYLYIHEDVTGWDYKMDSWKSYELLEWKSPNKHPTQDFKINLSNMSEAEKEVAKEWLVEVAESRGLNTKHLSEEDYVVNYVWIESLCFDYEQVLGYNVGTKDGCYRSKDLPELTLAFSKPAITSWSLPEDKSEKELQLEELVGKLQQQLEEAQQELEEIR